MSYPGEPVGRLPSSFLAPGTASFTDFLSRQAPELLPGHGPAGGSALADQTPHGTTIVAATFPDGVVMAGDRRSTMGNIIAQRDVEKVFPADEYSCIGIAGAAGVAVEMVRLFQLELEHYEKIEGIVLSLDGKANRLSHMIRSNLGLALQGLAVLPLFAGFDLDVGTGRIFSYDVTGGRSEEHMYYSVGSGSLFARGSLKKLFRPDLSVSEATTVCIQALYDAADDDSATGGPDLSRGIFPVVSVVDTHGYRRLAESAVAEVVETVVAARSVRPDGPQAPVQ